MDSPRLARPHRSIAAREVLDARARAWAFVFECYDRHTKKKAAPASGPDAGKEINERSGKSIIPE
jgi:hypothetical protein